MCILKNTFFSRLNSRENFVSISSSFNFSFTLQNLNAVQTHAFLGMCPGLRAAVLCVRVVIWSAVDLSGLSLELHGHGQAIG